MRDLQLILAASTDAIHVLGEQTVSTTQSQDLGFVDLIEDGTNLSYHRNVKFDAEVVPLQARTTERETRIDDHSAVLDEPQDHAVTSITQWCWRPPTNRNGNESPRPDGVKPDLTSSRPRCCKLLC